MILDGKEMVMMTLNSINERKTKQMKETVKVEKKGKSDHKWS